MKRRLRLGIPCLALGLAIACPARAAEDAFPAPPPGPIREDALPAPLSSARDVIARAFENFYYCDLRAELDFVVRRNGRTVLEYDTELLRKFIDGRAHDLFYFEGDGDMRGRRVLRIERLDRADDAFVYLPQLRRIRRTVMAQRGDKLLGMEVTLEDLEVQRIEKFEVVGSSFTQVAGEPAHIVTLKRLVGGSYDRVDFFVSSADYAMLEVRFYRGDALEPYKQTLMRREDMEQYPGHVLPRRIEFIDRDAGTETTLLFERREVDPELPSDRFSTLGLEKRQHLSWIRARAEEEARP
jgi:hypothetical protein